MGTGTGDLFRDAVGGHGCGYLSDAHGRARTRVYFLSQISCTAVTPSPIEERVGKTDRNDSVPAQKRYSTEVMTPTSAKS